MVRLDLREAYLGRVRERERRSSLRDSWSEEVVVEGRVESRLVGGLVGWLEYSEVVVGSEELMGLGSTAVGADVVGLVEAMLGYSNLCYFEGCE